MRTSPTNLKELYDQLEMHDWYYGFSDDHRVYSNGVKEEERLRVAAKTIEEGTDLIKAFHKHYFSGPSWKTEKTTKPERPI